MACKHACLGCLKTAPSPHETQTIGGLVYHRTLPACHPSAESHALVRGMPPEPQTDEKGSYAPTSLAERVSGFS